MMPDTVSRHDALRLPRWIAWLAVVVAALLSTGLLGGTAHAGSNDNGIRKLKTLWGGGFALNIGQNTGDQTNGAPAIAWYNRHNDWNNRWVLLNGVDGYYQYKNLFTQQCLAATGTQNYSAVVQQPCSGFDPKQRWGLAGNQLGQIGWHMPLRNQWVDQQSGATRVLTTQSTTNGAPIIMFDWQGRDTQYWKPTSCGYASPTGPISTPQDC